MNKDWSSRFCYHAFCLRRYQALAEAPPNHIDLSKFPATQLDDVVVPLAERSVQCAGQIGHSELARGT